jgi:hypothetical protein
VLCARVIAEQQLGSVAPRWAHVRGVAGDLLIDYARQIRAGGGAVELLQNNGRLAPWHARLLVRISGRITPGTAMFTGGMWPSLE